MFPKTCYFCTRTLKAGDSNILISAEISFILKKFNLHHENWHERRGHLEIHSVQYEFNI